MAMTQGPKHVAALNKTNVLLRSWVYFVVCGQFSVWITTGQ